MTKRELDLRERELNLRERELLLAESVAGGKYRTLPRHTLDVPTAAEAASGAGRPSICVSEGELAEIEHQIRHTSTDGHHIYQPGELKALAAAKRRHRYGAA